MKKFIKSAVKNLGAAAFVLTLIASQFPVGMIVDYFENRNIVDVMWQAKNDKSVVDLFRPTSAQAASEAVHHHERITSRQTRSSNTMATVMTVSAAELASAGFQANDEVLIMFWGNFASSGSILSEYEITYGGAGQVLTNSVEPRMAFGASGRERVSMWMGRVDLGGSISDIDVDWMSLTNGSAVYLEKAEIFVIRLSDFGTENVDWFWNKSTTAVQNTTTYSGTNRASVTWDPAGAEDWVAFAYTQTAIDSASVNAEVRLMLDGSLVAGDLSIEGETTAEEITSFLFDSASLDANSHTYSLETRDDGTGANDHRESAIFVFRKNAWTNLFVHEPGSVSVANATDVQVATITSSFASSQNAIMFGEGVLNIDVVNRNAFMWIRDGGSTIIDPVVDDGSGLGNNWSYDASDELGLNIMAYRSLSSGAQDLDLFVNHNGGSTETLALTKFLVWGLDPVPSVPINISGICVQGDGVTPCNDVGTLRVAINGVLQAQTDPTVDGSWSITGVTAPATGAVVTVFIDGAGDSDESAVITKYDGTGNISGMSMVAGTITIGSDDAATISNADIGHYDGDQDEDLPYTSNSNTLSTSVALIMTQGTYAPAGAVDVGAFYQIGGTVNGGSAAWNMGLFYQTAGTFNSTSGTLTLEFTGESGNIFTMTGGTFNHNNGTVLFDSYDNDCGSGFDYTFDVATSVTFYNLNIDQASDCVPSRTEVATGDYVVVNNILNLIDGSISGDFRIASTGNLTVGAAFNSGGNVTFTGSSAQTYTYSNGGAGPFVIVDKTGGAVTPSGATNMNMVGLVVSQGSFTAPTGTLTFTGYDDSEVTVLAVASGATFTHNSGTIYLDIDDNNCSFTQYYSFDADSPLTIGSLTIDIDSDCVQGVAYSEDQLITVSGNLTLTNGQIADNWVVQGNYTIGSSFDGGDAAITMTGTNAQNLSDASTEGMPTGDLTINKASGTVTMVSNADVMGSLLITSGTFDQGASYTLGVGAVTVGASGVWTNTGTGDVELYGNVSNAGTITLNSGGGTCGDADGITLTSPASESRTWSGAGTFNITDVTVSWMSGTMTAYSSTNGGNNSGWTFEDCPSVGITISGTISTSGGTLDCSTGGSRTVRAVVNGAGNYTGTCSLNTGAYTISSVVVEGGEVLTIYIDGATEKAVRVTKPLDDETAISDADLYQNFLAISHENGGPVTNSNLAQYDSTDDADVFFAVADSVLTMESGTTLFVEADKTFSPVGDVSAVNVVINGTLDASTSNPDITLTGNLTLESGSTYTKGTGEIIFAGGVAQTITDSNASKQDLGNVRIMEGSGGGGGGGESDWWNSSWTARRKITIDNSASSENLVDFPFLVKLDATNFDFTKTEGWGGAPTVVTDDFNRGSLGANWEAIDLATIVGNEFTCEDFEWCGIEWIANEFSSDVYVQALLASTGGSKYIQLSGLNSFHGVLCHSGSCNFFGGEEVWDEIFIENIFSADNDDVIRLEKEGNIFTVYKNGVEQWDYASSLDTSGGAAPMLASYSEGVLDNFEAGDVEQFGSGADLRFIDADGTTELPYEIETWDPENDTAYIWVKVPQIDAASEADFFWLYYDNPAETHDVSPTYTDDFNSGVFLNEDWFGYSVAVNGNQLNNFGADSWGVLELLAEYDEHQAGEMQIVSVTTSARIHVRSNPDGGYTLYCASGTCVVNRWSEISQTATDFFNFSYSANDYVKLEAEGNQIRAYKNGVLQDTETDSTFPEGGVNFALEGTGTTIDNVTVEGVEWMPYQGRNPRDVWSSDYMSVWHITQDDRAVYESVVGLHGFFESEENDVLLVEGAIGSGVRLDADDDQWISTQDLPGGIHWNFPQGASFTISAWVKPDSLLKGQVIAGMPWNYALEMALWGTPDSGIVGMMRGGGGSSNDVIATGNGGGYVSTSEFRHVVAVKDGTTVTFYVDGVAHAGDTTWDNSDWGGADQFVIGRAANWSYSEYFDGIIDEVRISSTTRSADWMEAEYLSGTNQMAAYSAEETNESEGGGGAEWYNEAWLNRKPITLDNSSSSSALTDFPVLVALSSSNIDYSKTQNAGQDIRFTSSDGTTLLSHEIETWNESGTSYVWVKVPTLAASADNTVYIYYNNSEASDGQDAEGVWDDDYEGVWHLGDGTTLSAVDSTSNGNDGTNSGYAAASGKVYGGASSNNTTNYIDIGSIYADKSAYTISTWVRLNSLTGTNSSKHIFGWGENDIATNGITLKEENSGGNARWNIQKNNNTVILAGPPVTDQWLNLTLVVNGNTTKFYIDGSLQDTNTSGSLPGSGSTFRIGRLPSSNSMNAGTVDEVRFSDGERSIDWIRAEYNWSNNPNTYNTFGGEEDVPEATGSSLLLTTNIRATSIAIDEENTLDLNSGKVLSISGDFTNNGIFAADGGTIALEGVGDSVIGGVGPIAFHHLSSVAAGKTVKMQAGKTFSFGGDLALTGSSGNLIYLESTEPGRQWLAHFTGEQDAVTYASIKDAGCAAGSANVEFGTGMTTGGNAAVCWFRIPLEIIRLQFGAGGDQVFSGGGDAASGGGSGVQGAASSSAGPNSPSSASGGTGWSGATNVYASDNSRAIHASANTNTLAITGFGFSIPTNATIVGFEILVEGHGSNSTASNRSIQAGLTKDGSALAGSYPSSQNLPQTTDNTLTFGASNSLFSTTWTPAEVNASNFGVLVRRPSNGTGSHERRIDRVQVRVHYTTPTGGATDGSSGGLLSVSDDFNRANGSLGANWFNYDVSLQIDSNRARLSSTGYGGVAWAANNFSTNQYSQARIYPGTGLALIYARDIIGGLYELNCEAGWCNVNKWDGSTHELVPGAFSYSEGDLVRLEVQGNVLRYYKNGGLIGSYTDSSDPIVGVGSPGFAISNESSATGTYIDDWSGGDLAPSGGGGGGGGGATP